MSISEVISTVPQSPSKCQKVCRPNILQSYQQDYYFPDQGGAKNKQLSSTAKIYLHYVSVLAKNIHIFSLFKKTTKNNRKQKTKKKQTNKKKKNKPGKPQQRNANINTPKCTHAERHTDVSKGNWNSVPASATERDTGFRSGARRPTQRFSLPPWAESLCYLLLPWRIAGG